MKFAKYLFPLLSAALIAGCGGSDDPEPTATNPLGSGTAQTIDKVAETGGFNALLAAATKANLAPALADPAATLTVFAPTDEAFGTFAQRLGFASATAMVDALPPAALKNILSYHVLPAIRPASELTATAQSTPQTLYEFEGKPATLQVNSGASGVTIGDAVLTTAKVTAADVSASNGVVHAIDKVLVPPGVLNIVQMAQANPQLSSLVDAVVSTNLQGTLAGAGPFTVFAPTNTAFAGAPTGLTTQQLTTVLTYHALGTSVKASEIPFGAAISTLANQSIIINAGNPPTITDTTPTPAQIIATDVKASNGVIHLIDKVLIPTL